MIISPAGFVHATAIAFGDRGVLIRGRSQAGKSTLAAGLIALGQDMAEPALLVGDDRVSIAHDGNALRIAPHPAIAGLIEERGHGLRPIAHRPSARLCLVIDLVAGFLGEMGATEEIILGLSIPRRIFSERPAAKDVFPLVLAALAK